MAEQLKPEDAAPAARLTREAVRSGISTINAEKSQASEYQGAAAKATQEFCDKFNLDKKAVTTVSQLAKKELPQAQSVLRDLIRVADLYGLFDQMDAFVDADLISTMEAIVARTRQSADASVRAAE